MSLRLSQRQLDALRADAIEEGRTMQRREDIQRMLDRTFARPPWEGRIAFATWADARQGTVLLATDDGRSFYKYARIERVVPEGEDTGNGRWRDGNLWVEYTLMEGGTGGLTVKPDERIMVIGDTVKARRIHPTPRRLNP